MRKALVVLLATIFVTAVAWAQYTDPLLGPHNVNNAAGCTACHAPHNAVLEGSNGYLWANAIPTKTYTTYGGGTINASAAALNADGTVATSLTTANTLTGGNDLNTGNNDTVVHTVLCLSCHDTVFSGMTLTNANNAVVDAAGTSLTNNHPVHVAWPNVGGAGDPTFWNVTVTSGSAKFSDASGAAFSYGHPTRLFVATGTSTPYVECGTCHNPHAYQNAVVKVGTTSTAVTTAHFVRGQYDTLGNQQNFCVSCHADKSGAWNGTGAQ